MKTLYIIIVLVIFTLTMKSVNDIDNTKYSKEKVNLLFSRINN